MLFFFTSSDHRERDKLQETSHNVPVEELTTQHENFCRNEIARQVTTEIARCLENAALRPQKRRRRKRLEKKNLKMQTSKTQTLKY